jgi:t-SNARE complex subunit (syntaxin)
MKGLYGARSNPFKESNTPIAGPNSEEMTASQEEALQMIKDTDKEIDAALDGIELGMDHLKDMANTANKEVKRQQGMIDNVAENMEGVQEGVDDVNDQLKITMGKAQRGCDKIMCDAFCICIMVGLIVALVKMSEGL